jgi:hypothetical protein
MSIWVDTGSYILEPKSWFLNSCAFKFQFKFIWAEFVHLQIQVCARQITVSANTWSCAFTAALTNRAVTVQQYTKEGRISLFRSASKTSAVQWPTSLSCDSLMVCQQQSINAQTLFPFLKKWERHVFPYRLLKTLLNRHCTVQWDRV